MELRLVGYRRFFTVNELAGLRQEEPRVFAATHEWIAALLMADLIDGVRVDHPDGCGIRRAICGICASFSAMNG